MPYVANHYCDGVSAVYALADPKYPTPEPIVVEEKVEEVPAAVEDEPVVDDVAKEDEKVEEVAVVEGEVETKEDEKVVESEEALAAPIETEDVPMEAPVVVEEVKEEAPVVPVVSPVQSRIFGLYLVGNKYNPSNYL